MKVLFWNTHNNININTILGEIIIENGVDIIALAEYSANIDNLIDSLKECGIEMQKYVCSSQRITVIGNINNAIPALQDDKYSFQIINGYIFCFVHLPSQIYTNNEAARIITIDRIITDTNKIERKNNTENTIIVGDFNINPFDYGMIAANHFHSIPFYDIAKKNSRIIENQNFKMFYNPMWRFFGDLYEPYGTHYYSGSRADNIFWNIYDQVMIRPTLRQSFVDENLKIITETSTYSLLNKNGHPDKKKVSDHLPLLFEIKEN